MSGCCVCPCLQVLKVNGQPVSNLRDSLASPLTRHPACSPLCALSQVLKVNGQPVNNLKDLVARACYSRPPDLTAFPCISTQQVLKVNGQPVNNLKDLVAAVAGSEGQYLSLDLEYNQVGKQTPEQGK